MQSPPQLSNKGKKSRDTRSISAGRELRPLGFYPRYGKRIVDSISSALGLVLLSPLFGLTALCIKWNSPGPVFFRQCRIGKTGRPFLIVKFRSMDESASLAPAGVTVLGDTRITAIGRILRRYKIDELPQLWNVLLGDMSLVGPRPELAKFVVGYSYEQRLVLSVRPGITDPASLFYRNEEEILSSSADPEKTYRTQILPDKLSRNISYISRISFHNDLHIVWSTMIDSFLSGGLLRSKQDPGRPQDKHWCSR